MVKLVYDSFAVSGQFDAVALIEVKDLARIKDVTTEIQNIKGVERTETLVQVI
jgi:DNA-binding Lrp family transcriptional regulator